VVFKGRVVQVDIGGGDGESVNYVGFDRLPSILD